MRTRSRFLGRGVLALAVAGTAGWLVFHQRAIAEARGTRDRLAARYGDGCVAVIPGRDKAAPIRCRIGGVEVGYTNVASGEAPAVGIEGMCVDPADAQSAFVIETYAPDGLFLSTLGKVTFFDGRKPLGTTRISGRLLPPGEGPPLVVALRRAKPGE